MSYSRSKSFAPKGVFTGWYVDNTPESTLADKFSPYLRNTRLDWMASIIRPWHTLLTSFTDTTNPKWLGVYLRTNPANDVMVVRSNESWTEKLVTVQEDWTKNNITTSALISSDNKMTFNNIWDVIYCMNWSDDFWKLDWTTYTTPTTGITNFAPSYWVVFNSSLFCAGWSTNPNKVYKSVWDDYEDFSSTWSDNFTFQEQITWLATNNETLFYFTQNSIASTWASDVTDTWTTISYITRWLQVKWWAVNHHSIVNAWTNIFFVTPTNKICRVARWQNIDWFEVFEMSQRQYAWINKLMATLDNDQTDSFWYYLEQDNLIKWFFKSKWASFNDVCVVYDLIQDAFLIDNNKYFYDWVVFHNKNFTISHIENKIFQDEFWTDDEDSAIQFRYETKEFDLWIPTRKKEFWEARTYLAINENTSITQEIYVDWWLIDSKTIDKDNIPITTSWIWTKSIWTYAVWTWWLNYDDNLYYVDLIRTKWNLQVKGKKIRFVYTCWELSARARLENLEMMVEILPTETNNLTL